MEIIKPYRVFNAFNPAILTVTNPTDPAKIARVRLDFVINGGLPDVFSLSIYRESFNNEVRLDIAKIAKNLFDDKLTNINARIFTDTYFAKTFDISVIDLDNNVNAWVSTVLFSVSQFGESSLLSAKQGTYLTRRTSLVKYKDYPLDVAVLAFNSSDNSDFIIVGTNDLEQWTISNVPHFFISVADNDTSVNIYNKSSFTELTDDNYTPVYDNNNNLILVYDSTSGFIMHRLAVTNSCTPINPFYVRWVNELGGFDYQMFSVRQVNNMTAENETSYLQYYEDQSVTTRAKKTINLEVSEAITFGVSNLNKLEYSIVRQMLISPRIEYYNKDINKWLALYRDDSVQVSYDNFNERYTFEATLFTNPKILQF